MSEQLKPCPFCGSRNVAHGLFGGDMVVKCIGCSSGGPPVDAPDFSDMVEKREQAIAAWNSRAMQENWQSMDTAPKDGRHVLLYCEYYGIGRCAWESWRKVWRSDDPNHGIGFPDPTHWMPLPDIPAGSVRAEIARRAALPNSEADQP